MARVERWRIHGKALLRKILLPQKPFRCLLRQFKIDRSREQAMGSFWPERIQTGGRQAEKSKSGRGFWALPLLFIGRGTKF